MGFSALFHSSFEEDDLKRGWEKTRKEKVHHCVGAVLRGSSSYPFSALRVYSQQYGSL